MIHFKNNKILSPWGKGFLTSVLGTTISILLTFGTSALVDSKMKADIQRQTAMMVIHDIDECVEKMEKIAEYEEKKNKAVQYILAHIDQIDSLPEDTLQLAMDMFTDYDGDPRIFDDSKENIFKSSQDIWSDLDNMAFVDNMEQFYHERKYVQNQMATSPIFKDPITHDEYWQMVLDSWRSDHSLDYAAILKAKLRDRKIAFHIDHSPNRARLYRRCAQNWRDISDRNKFIMNIDDEELVEYIRKSQRSGNPVGRRDLIGQWERKARGTDDYYYEFLENDSFYFKTITHYANSFYDGDILWKAKIRGKWQVDGDSLILVYDTKYVEVKTDRSGVTYRPEMRDSVENFFRRYFDEKKATEHTLKQLESQPKRDTFCVTINKAHDKLEVDLGGSDGDISTRYFKRVKEGK